MSEPRPIVTLTTDYGTGDGYPGAMKGVILGICREARVLDITHEIPPMNVAQAALVIQSVVDYFPPETIHVVVVDPEVGTERRGLAIDTPQARFVGPDNGVFGLIWEQAKARWPRESTTAVVLAEPRYFLPQVSPTFHGRDVFAAVAAHLARGVSANELGPRVESIEPAPLSEPAFEGNATLVGQVISVDRFGNCICDISSVHLVRLGSAEELVVLVGDLCMGAIRRTYADVATGAPLALLSSTGRLELAVRNGSMFREFNIQPGTKVWVSRSAPKSD